MVVEVSKGDDNHVLVNSKCQGFCWSCILGSPGPLKVWVNSAPWVILKMTSMIPYVSEVIEHPFIIIRRIWLVMPRDKYFYTHTVSIHLLIFYEIYHGKSPVFHHDLGNLFLRFPSIQQANPSLSYQSESSPWASTTIKLMVDPISMIKILR